MLSIFNKRSNLNTFSVFNSEALLRAVLLKSITQNV